MKRITNVLRVDLNEEYYVLIFPKQDKAYNGETLEGWRDFWLFKSHYGISEFMFGCKIESNREAIELAENIAHHYIQQFEENVDYWDSQPINND